MFFLYLVFKVFYWAVVILLLPFKALRFVFRKMNQKIKEINENANSQNY